jgi:hypothetical protein
MSIERKMLEADVLIIGADQFSGAIMDPCELPELFQDFKKSAALRTPVAGGAPYCFAEGDSYRLPITPSRCGGARTARKGRAKLLTMKNASKLLLLLTASTMAHAQMALPPQTRPIVFTHVTVIDATGAAPRPDVTVLITGDRIADVGKNVSVPSSAQVVDATGKFLIPGLWDMHVHIHREDELTLLIVNGVTGVRLMSAIPEHFDMQRRVDAGQELGPRMILSSRMMDGPRPGKTPAPALSDKAGQEAEVQGIVKGSQTLPEIVTNAADAQRAVMTAKQMGAAFIKIHSDLSREAFFALAAESKKQGFQFEGHVPTSISAAEASNVGQRSIEHAGGVLTGCTSREPELRAATLDAESKPPEERAPLMLAVRKMTLASYSPADCTALAELFVKNQTWQCPTLVMTLGGVVLNKLNADMIKYQDAPMRESWQKRLAAVEAHHPSAEQDEVSREINEQLYREVALMRHAGVRFLAGTDDGGMPRVQGFDLHFELEQLNKAGLTPMEVLQTATINPAIFLGEDKELGTIEKGKIADVVLLNANPLDQITNTRKIDSVVVNGHLLDRKTMDAMLDQVAVNAK